MPHKLKPLHLVPVGRVGSFRWQSAHSTQFGVTRPREKNNLLMTFQDKYDMRVSVESKPGEGGHTHKLAFHITRTDLPRGAPEAILYQRVHSSGKEGQIRVQNEDRKRNANAEEKRVFTQMAQNVMPLLRSHEDTGYYKGYGEPFKDFKKVFLEHYPTPKELKG